MTRQNRVLPTGEIAAVAARGTLTGNRGILHDAEGRLGVARWRHPHWISCELSYKGGRRKVMSPGSWTELFFLDEAVALAAGHRPCALCRRDDFRAFQTAWARAFGSPATAPEIDHTLHAARVDRRTRLQMRYEDDIANLPEGTFILHGGTLHLVARDRVMAYAPEGYGAALPPPTGSVTVLTPRPLVSVLAAGYRPRMHLSAAAEPAPRGT